MAMKKIEVLAAVLIGLLVVGCDEQPEKPFLKIAGGGFIYNYRYASVNYGFVAMPLRPLPDGSILEASFDVPDKPDKYIITLPAVAGKTMYGFETQALHGVKKEVSYRVKLRLVEPTTGKELALLERDFRSNIDQSSLPTKAPVQGIGYFPAPQ
jgi:hypothetical protein